MAATYRSGSVVATKIESLTDPWSVDGPAGAAAGDMVVLALEFFVSETGPDSIGSFTAGPQASEGTVLTDGRGLMLYAPFDTVGAGPYSIGFPSTADGLAHSLSLQGVDLAAPLNVASTALDDDTLGLTWTCTGQTTTVDGCCIVGVGGASPNGAGNTWAITAGTTQRIFSILASENHAMVVGTLDQASAGTVTTSGTNSANNQTYGLQMAFAPAAAAGAAPNLLNVQSGLSWG